MTDFDLEKFKGNEAFYDVDFFMFKSDVEPKLLNKASLSDIEHITNKGRKACFAYLDEVMRTKKSVNRVLFVCKFEHHKKEHLSKEEIVRWVELCKEAGFVPTDLNENFTEDGEMCLALDKHNRPMLYLYLSSMRHIQENPSFVRLVLYLIDEKGMGLYTAMTLASYYAICNTGHHFIYANRYMASAPDFAKATKIDLTPGVKFYKFMQSDIETFGSTGKITFGVHAISQSIKVKSPLIVLKDQLCEKETEEALRNEQPQKK